VTLTAQLPQAGGQQNLLIPSTYDNVTKLLRIQGQDHVGAVTYGAGAIGMAEPRTAQSYIPELEQELTNVPRLSVEDFANRLSEFFLQKWQAQAMPPQGQDMCFLVGGYDEGAAYGRVFEVFIPSRPTPVEWHSGPRFGIVWGGQREYADRLITGFDGNLPNIAKQFLSLTDQQSDALRQEMQGMLQAPVPFAFLPLQDCVDLAIFLIRTTILMQRWVLGIRGVGGAIDVAVITQTDGFVEIQKKRITGETTWPLS
jgi:hypothetical protein